MSKQYDIKRNIMKLIENPQDREAAVQILLDATNTCYEDFQYDNGETPEQYLFDE